ncbi:hypothetical protein PENTCL1PPCAC_18682, partial [Pristionchus entomophagus]
LFAMRLQRRLFDASSPMRAPLILLTICAIVTFSTLEPSPEELLDSISLSEENVLRFYPKYMENMNEKIRAYVAGILPFEEICKGTYKPNLCSNKLRRPIEALMKAFTSLIDYESRNDTAEAKDSHCVLKRQIEKLSNDKVIAIPPFLMAEYPRNTTIPREDFGDTLNRLKNTIDLINNIVSTNGLQGFNYSSEVSDILKKQDVFEATLSGSV